MRFISGIILIIVAVALFFGFTNPKYQATKPVRDKVAQLDEALTKAKELTELRDELTIQYNAFTPEEIKKLNTMLPDSIDAVRLIIDVDSIADRHDLSVANISVTGNEEGQATGPDSRAYGIANVSFSVATTYDRFKTFLADLERSMRLLDITSISFGQPDAVGRTTYSIRAQTYWLR